MVTDPPTHPPNVTVCLRDLCRHGYAQPEIYTLSWNVEVMNIQIEI